MAEGTAKTAVVRGIDAKVATLTATATAGDSTFVIEGEGQHVGFVRDIASRANAVDGALGGSYVVASDGGWSDMVGANDLAVRVAAVRAMGMKFGRKDQGHLTDAVFLGTLTPRGELQSTHGEYTSIVQCAKSGAATKFVVSTSSGGAARAALRDVPGIEIWLADSCAAVSRALADGPDRLLSVKPLSRDESQFRRRAFERELVTYGMLGPSKRRALEIATVGRLGVLAWCHPNVGNGDLLPGLGRALVALLPDPSPELASVIERIHDVAGLRSPRSSAVVERPFRAPHPLMLAGSLAGTRYRRGEASLAHGGVLFLDDILSFTPTSIQALREVLSERAAIHDGRAVPAEPMVVVRANRCIGDGKACNGSRCVCSAADRATYRSLVRERAKGLVSMEILVDVHAAADGPESLREAMRRDGTEARERVRAAYDRSIRWNDGAKEALRTIESASAMAYAADIAGAAARLDDCDIGERHVTEAKGYLRATLP